MLLRISNSTLINGLGRYSGGPESALAVITVQQGMRYRFRLINMACRPYYVFSIDGHTFTVIEVDGAPHKPYVVDSIRIFAGERVCLTRSNFIDCLGCSRTAIFVHCMCRVLHFVSFVLMDF